MSHISERNDHLRPKKGSKLGYCLICENYGLLSVDHVPPKSCIHTTKAEQRLLTEVMGSRPLKKPVKAKTGSAFLTICATCNSERIGRCDEEVSKAHKELHRKIQNHFQSRIFVPGSNIVTAEVNARNYARAMIGHILSATTSQDCVSPPKSSAYFDPLKRFVMGDDSAIEHTHDLHYWFYPHAMHISAKFFQFRNQGHNASLSALHFNPIAFLISEKNSGIYPAQARRLSLNDSHLILSLDLTNQSFSQFPLCGLKGDQLFALHGPSATVSYPVGN